VTDKSSASRALLQRRVRVICSAAALASVVVPVHAQQVPGAGDALRDLGDKAQLIPPPKPKPALEVAPDTRRAVKPLPGFKIDVKGFRFSRSQTSSRLFRDT